MMVSGQQIREHILKFLLENGTVTWARLFSFLKDKDLLGNYNTYNYHLRRLQERGFIEIQSTLGTETLISIGVL